MQLRTKERALAVGLDDPHAWPELPLEGWKDTYATLHMWTQIVGKIRLTLSPPMNHWWHCPLYVTPRGLTTSLVPYRDQSFEIELDFAQHNLVVRKDDAALKVLPLVPRTVADFYAVLMASLHALGIDVQIHATPDEVPNPIPFAEDRVHTSYDPVYVERFARILRTADVAFRIFRSRFIGKCSPVHFFWGSFDLAVTRFSGRRAPERAGADGITREAYSHENISAGFWPGGGPISGPAFYSYTAPEPPALREQKIRPSAAYYHPELKELLLMYDDVRSAPSPTACLLEFLQSTYEAGANLAGWDRASLERPPAESTPAFAPSARPAAP